MLPDAQPSSAHGALTSADVDDEVLDGLLLNQLGEEAGPVGLHLDARRLGQGQDVVGLQQQRAGAWWAARRAAWPRAWGCMDCRSAVPAASLPPLRPQLTVISTPSSWRARQAYTQASSDLDMVLLVSEGF